MDLEVIKNGTFAYSVKRIDLEWFKKTLEKGEFIFPSNFDFKWSKEDIELFILCTLKNMPIQPISMIPLKPYKNGLQKLLTGTNIVFSLFLWLNDLHIIGNPKKIDFNHIYQLLEKNDFNELKSTYKLEKTTYVLAGTDKDISFSKLTEDERNRILNKTFPILSMDTISEKPENLENAYLQMIDYLEMTK